jgi:CubicO group peptidase (beta-lactamase class C family)
MRFLKRFVCLGLLVLLTIPAFAQDSTTYTAPDGSYTFPLPDGWNVEEFEGYVVVTDPDNGIELIIATVPGEDMVQAIIDTYVLAKPDFDATDYTEDEVQVLEASPALGDFEGGTNIFYNNGSNGEAIEIGSGSLYQGNVYVLLITAELVTLQQRSSQFQIIATGFRASGMEVDDITDVTANTWNADIQAEFEAFVTDTISKLETPGVSIAIVQDGEIVYSGGFGRLNSQDTAVNADTYMMIGSTTKPMTTLLMAQGIDAGLYTWDTPIVEVYPDFAVQDPEITAQFRMQDLVCACTGVPRRDFELILNSEELNAKGVLDSLQTFEFFTEVGEAFQYSNQLVASAGYVTAYANGIAIEDLDAGYAQLMEDNIFAPLGMTRTTLDFAEVEADPNHANPYTNDLSGEVELTARDEEWASAIAPAGAIWSTANDMGLYMIMEMNNGLLPDGSALISEENLLETRNPRVQINDTTSYGLGLFVGEYKSIPVYGHGGNTFGFSSGFDFMPSKGIGIVVLTNEQLSAVPSLVTSRFFELMLNQDDETTPTVEQILENVAEAQENQPEILETVDRSIAGDFVGEYTNDALGDLNLYYVDDSDTLVADFGVYQIEIWTVLPSEDEESGAEATPEATQETTAEVEEPNYVISRILTGLTLDFVMVDGQPTIVLGQGGGVNEYTFTVKP